MIILFIKMVKTALDIRMMYHGFCLPSFLLCQALNIKRICGWQIQLLISWGNLHLKHTYLNIVQPWPQTLNPKTPSVQPQPSPNLRISSKTQLDPRGLGLTLKSCRQPKQPKTQIVKYVVKLSLNPFLGLDLIDFIGSCEHLRLYLILIVTVDKLQKWHFEAITAKSEETDEA